MTFTDFLKLIDLRFLQERDVGLDLFLSGVWGILPVLTAVVALTIFVLSIFYVIPSRKKSVPLLIACAVLATGVGFSGTYMNFKLLSENPEAETSLAVFARGQGRRATDDSQRSTLVAEPLLAGAAVGIASLGCAVFLLVFGGRDSEKKKDRVPDLRLRE